MHAIDVVTLIAGNVTATLIGVVKIATPIVAIQAAVTFFRNMSE
jgi:hypothetical protein